MNSTVYLTRIAGFLCPSDGQAGVANINNYRGSIGTTVVRGSPSSQVSGLFSMSSRRIPTGAATPRSASADATDGTSNTIAFGEALVGVEGRGNGYRGNGMSAPGRRRTSIRIGTGQDVQQKPATSLTAALAECNTFWQCQVLRQHLGQGHEGPQRVVLGRRRCAP